MSTPTPITVEAVHCLICDDVIWSEHRHDFKFCSCGECYVDGGRDYFRVGFTRRSDVEFGRLILGKQKFVVEDEERGSDEDGTPPAR